MSRVFFRGKFFNYPISLSFDTLRKLGAWTTLNIMVSYVYARAFPIRPEVSLADFFRNRFGYVLYRTFFADYTEKVWGVKCSSMPAAWGAQRVKGLSITAVLMHALKSVFRLDKSVAQKNTQTSLIEQFLYPKFGPGQLWERVADLVAERGGEVRLGTRVTELHKEGSRITSASVIDCRSGKEWTVSADYVFSTMPISELIPALGRDVPEPVKEVAEGLVYRDFVTVWPAVAAIECWGWGAGGRPRDVSAR